ncbi:MAG: GNAT family N-acetyltransferase [Pirellulaceae bacterium]|nr:GNAT family N-acetyltransferase [Pirellulaceae bacterium]
MKISSIPAHELSPDLVERWREVLRSAPQFGSPYFRPEFVQAVAACRDNVEVGLLEENAAVVGFFPFQRGRWNVAQPVGLPLSDFQGVIASENTAWRVNELLAGCRLAACEFDHQLASQSQWEPFQTRVAPSPWLDLAAGFEGYLAQRKAAGARSVSETLRKARKLEREAAELRFEWQTADETAWPKLIEWKSAQYRRSGVFNLFSEPWVLLLLDRLRSLDTPEFAGRLSVLWADGKPLAVHFGLASGGVLHYWFPTYDPEQTRGSPGLVLLLKLAEAAAARGIRRLDLGKGPEEYKQSFASGATLVAEGCADLRPLAATLRGGWRQAREWVRNSPLKTPAKMPLRWLRRMREWLAPQQTPTSSHP